MARSHRYVLVVSALLLGVTALSAQGATFVVTSTNDSGAGSLRDAIDAANGDAEASSITFAPALAGATIVPLSPLPGLTEAATTIDGDLGGDCDPDVVLSGQLAGPGNGLNLFAPAGGHRIRGLAIVRFDGDGIAVGSTANTLTCNHIGTDLAFAPGLGNAREGVWIQGSDNVIGPSNVIESNTLAGVHVTDGILPGYPEFTALTPDFTGTFAAIDFTEVNQVFQTTPGGFTPLDGGGRPFTENFGMRLRGELVISTTGTYSFTIDPLDDNARLTVAGTELINGNGPGPLSANLALAAGAHAVRLDFLEGGGFSAVRLVINGPGIATFNTNQQAVCATGQPGLCGELFQLRIPSEGNTITGNRIGANGRPGIALTCCYDVLPNDVGDIDLGPNTWLNHPVITGLTSAGNAQYNVLGSAPPNATIEVFEAIADPSGYGGSGSPRGGLAANAGGNLTGVLTLPATPGLLTATATDAAGNTSMFGPNIPYGVGDDAITIAGAAPVVAGASRSFAIHVRDVQLTPLGVDRATGERIQGLALRVDFPLNSLTAASIVPDGVALGLTPLFGPTSNFTPSSVTYLVAYAEAGNPIPFNLDAAAPGDVVARLDLTVHPGHLPGTNTLDLTNASELSNQAGTIAENVGNGTLLLLDGAFTTLSNAPRGLYTAPQSTSAIRLTWFDPDLVETGFRVQRSTDGINYTNVADLGPAQVSFDDGGLAADTLYYYRVRTLVGADEGGASNRATASTFPSVAAKICANPQTVSRRWARAPAVAFRGPDWGLVYHARDDGSREQVFFQRLDGNTLAALGPRVQVSTAAVSASFARIAWNGTHYAVTWTEDVAGAPGSPYDVGLRFAQLDGNGTILRTSVRPPSAPPTVGENYVFVNSNYPTPRWDGTHWGIFSTRFTLPFTATVDYRRLEANGRTVLGPIAIASSTTAYAQFVDAAWQALASEYGVAWVRQQNQASEVLFQRVDEANGATLLGSPSVIASYGGPSLLGPLSLVADPAGGWLIAWSQCDDITSDCPIYTRRIAASGVPDPGGAVRISPLPAPDPAEDWQPFLVAHAGGFDLFVETGFPPEITRYELDATGASDGLAPTPVSVADGRTSARPIAASDGARALAAWSEAGTLTLEVAGRLSTFGGALGPEVAFTTGHDTGNTPNNALASIPGRIVPVGAGFAAIWLDPVSGAPRIHGRLYDATGAVIADYAPFSTNATGGLPGMARLGNSFAVAWRSGGNLRFTRISDTGTVLVPETVVATGTGGNNQSVELGWDGENFTAVWAQGGYRYLRIGADGTPIGTPQVLALGPVAPNNVFRIAWMGDAWALLFRSFNVNLFYARFRSDGSVALAPTQISDAVAGGVGGDPSLVYNGTELAASWNELRNPGLDPPGFQTRFTVLNRDGSEAFPDVALNPQATGTGRSQLFYANGRFHMVHVAGGDLLNGAREIDIDLIPGGAVATPGRYVTNRTNGSAAVTHNGATLGMAWQHPPSSDWHVQTGVCLDDPTPPPCPALSISSLSNKVRLSWPTVGDPDSGVFRYHVYRDGYVLAELPNSVTQYDDAGYDIAVTHGYALRAMNRAFQESPACPVQNFSTLVGDANGNGILDVADIFYLINFTLASGPPPLGDSDANGDGVVSVTDVFFLINYFFGGGPPPAVASR